MVAMKLLKDLKAGNVIEEPTQAPSAGSWLHKEEIRKAQERDEEKKDRRNRRERSSSARQRYTSRSRGRTGDPHHGRNQSRQQRSRSGGRGRDDRTDRGGDR